ncbi:MAG: tetratricopeptide repeat protein [Rudaea sp.]|uniref:SirB1 family protein n=1 Tax=unclassified Rudaea TaxID=2627037 RepID=UPI0010F9E6C7|nr:MULTISPECIES: tetratricopeptide repeat protein [unclassified Rudaea]MBN8885446.1 tetratricopeptide repeat protein [Rudaea sp.]MBR0344499.1 tetratricopeptide repeat protein [Rudaea sp.]
MHSDNSWIALRGAKDEDIPLFSSALLIAKDEYPELASADYESQLRDYGERLRKILDPTETAATQLRTLNGFLFDELGFSGNEQDYYDPRNSYLNDVLDRRLGNPISLAVVQIELARRLDVPLEGVSFPGHFLVRLPLDEGIVVLDPFQKGRSLDAAELRRRARTHLDTHDIDDARLARMLEPASHRAILTRMLRNLKGVYAEREQWDKALRCCDRLLTLDSHQPGEYRDRGQFYLKLGHVRAASEDLRRYLALMPQAEDADTVSLQLAEIGTNLPRLN